VAYFGLYAPQHDVHTFPFFWLSKNTRITVQKNCKFHVLQVKLVLSHRETESGQEQGVEEEGTERICWTINNEGSPKLVFRTKS